MPVAGGYAYEMQKKASRTALVVLFVHGAIERLCQRGLIEGEPLITPRGISAYDQLRASGFRPTAEEVSRVIRNLGLAKIKSETGPMTLLILNESGHDES